MSSNVVFRFISAVVVTYFIAVLLVSQFNASSIAALGVEVGLDDRARAFAHDVIGMLELYLPMIAIGFLVALLFTGQVLLRFFGRSSVMYPLAGFVAIATLHIVLKAVFDIWPVAPAATPLGFLSQCLAGAVGGYVFYRLAPSH